MGCLSLMRSVAMMKLIRCVLSIAWGIYSFGDDGCCLFTRPSWQLLLLSQLLLMKWISTRVSFDTSSCSHFVLYFPLNMFRSFWWPPRSLLCIDLRLCALCSYLLVYHISLGLRFIIVMSPADWKRASGHFTIWRRKPANLEKELFLRLVQPSWREYKLARQEYKSPYRKIRIACSLYMSPSLLM